MKALCRAKNGELRLQEMDEPQVLRPEDVKIRVRYCTLCSDEMRMDHPGDFFNQVGIVGHEMSGEIVELGAMARYSDFQIGDRVGVEPAVSCGVCPACQNDRSHHCANLNFRIGTICEYVVRSYRQLIKLPAHISFQEGCFLEAVAAVLQGIESAGICYNTGLAIFGGGFAGLMFAQIAGLRGAKHITLIEPLAVRRALAKQRGVEHVLDDLGDELYQRTGAITDFCGYDVVVETSAKLHAADAGLRIVSRGGTMLLYTYYGVRETLALNTMNMYLENLNVRFSFSSHGKHPEALRLLPQLRTKELIGTEFRLADSAQAYALQKTRQHVKIGIII